MMRLAICGLATALIVGSAGIASAQPGGSNQGTPVGPGEACPAGMTAIRPGRCVQPQITAPRRLDYRPRRTRVTAVHGVRRARDAPVDVHGRVRNWIAWPWRVRRLVRM